MQIANKKIEQTVLASFLKENLTDQAYQENLKYLQDLKIEYFETREHQHILRVLQILDQSKYDLESLIIESKLNEKAQQAYLDVLTVNSVTNVYNYIKMLQENFQKNQIQKEIIALKKQIADGSTLDTSKLIEKLNELEKIKSQSKTGRTRDTKHMEDWKNVSTNNERMEASKNITYLNKVIVKGEVTMIAARPGAGKSLTTLSQIRESLQKNDIEAVYYLDMDNSESTLADRQLGPLIKKYEDKLFYVLGSTCSQFELDRKIRDLTTYDLTNCHVIFDSAKNFMRGGDRDKNKDVSKVTEMFKALRNAGATVTFLHHTNKPQKDFDQMYSSFAGSSAWLEDATNAFILDRNEDKATFIFNNIKARNGKFEKEIAYKLDQETMLLTEVDPEDARITEEDQDCLDDIRIYLLDNLKDPQSRTQNRIVKYLTNEGYGRNQAVRLLKAYINKKWTLIAQDTLNGRKVFTLMREVKKAPEITTFQYENQPKPTIPQNSAGRVGQWDTRSLSGFENQGFEKTSGTGGTPKGGFHIWNENTVEIDMPDIF